MLFDLYLLIIIVIFNFFLILNFDFFSKLYGLYDFPNEKRKKQSNPVPLFGGLIIFTNLLIYLIYELLFGDKEIFFDIGARSNIQIFTFCFTAVYFFLIGYIDDKLNLKPFTKIISLLIILIVFFSIIEKSVINELSFYNFNKKIDLYELGLPFTILCVLVLTNALNMMDGIDMVSFIFFSFLFSVFVLNGYLINFSIIMIVGLLFFSSLNYKGKSYLGDSGVYILSFLVSIYIISFYENKNFFVEDILILTLLPICDFFRLFVLRIYNKKSPFLPDRNHFHHIIETKFNKKKSLLIFSSFVFVPTLINHFKILNPIVIVVLFLFLYFYVIYKINLSK